MPASHRSRTAQIALPLVEALERAATPGREIATYPRELRRDGNAGRVQQRRQLGQFDTPAWAAERLLELHFGDLGSSDVVVDPTAGIGNFLQAVPVSVRGYGVELDPARARLAQERTGRLVVTGDFRSVALPEAPTAFIGNPPFQLDVVAGILDRAYDVLPMGGRAGFILPAYAFQTASRVAALAEKWSIQSEMIPRNLFPGLKLPLVFAIFSREVRRRLIGFSLYHETVAVHALAKPYRELLATARGSVWRAVVVQALRELGGEASLHDVYDTLAGRRPTATQHWQPKVRQQVQRLCVRTGPARWRLREEFGGDARRMA